MSADLVQRAIDRFSGVIDGNSVDWSKYLKPSDVSRIVPIENLAEKAKERMLLGAEAEEGLQLPWSKTHGKVLIRDGKLALWAGWSRHGKTRMLKQVMLDAIRQERKVLIASMEEEIMEVWIDLCTMFAGTDTPSPKQIDAFVDYAKSHLWLYDQQGEVEGDRIKAVVRYAAKELGTTQAMVDSLMMLAVPRDDYEAQSLFVGGLKTLAKDSHCTVHLVAHMRKRDGKGGEEQPGTLHDISGGHEIGSKADYVFIPWRDMRDNKPLEAPDCILKVDKARGRVNWLGKIGLSWHAPSSQFSEGFYAPRYTGA